MYVEGKWGNEITYGLCEREKMYLEDRWGDEIT